MALNLDDNTQPIVLDNGSGTIKLGFAGDDAPRVVFPNIIGYERHVSTTVADTTKKEFSIGDTALKYKSLLNIQYPVKHGIVTNWDDMATIWRYAFHKELRLASIDRPILVTEAPTNPISNRVKMAQILFEYFQAPAIYVANPGVLSFMSTGRHAALMVDIGDGVAYCMAAEGMHRVPHAENRVDYAGRDLNDYLARLLAERDYSFTTTAEREIVRDIKEKLAYVALDFEEELSKNNEIKYELPDRQKISIGNERFRCAEALFRPKSIGISELGIGEIIYDTLMKADIDIRPDMYCNILVAGGTTLLVGFKQRLEKEMRALIPTVKRTRIVAGLNRQYATWIGGSILASLSTFRRMWITKQEYDEFGPTIVHRKCN